MASISRRVVGGKPRYDVNYREPDGRRRRKTFIRRTDADAFAAAIEVDKMRGRYLDPDAGRITFRKYAGEWLSNRAFAPTTYERIESRLRVHAYPVLGGKTLVSIKPSTVQAWIANLPGAASSRREIVANVSAVFTAAVDDERIPKNPFEARSVAKPKRQSKKIVPWPVARVAEVHDRLADRYKILILLGVGLGLRQGEIFGLSPDDVDFERELVMVRRQVRILNGNRLVFALPKRDRTRTVPLPSSLAEALKAYLGAFEPKTVTLPWSDRGGKPTAVRLVVTTRQGGALNRNTVNTQVWKPALAKASVDASPHSGNGMHALRHHYASVLLDAGESIKALSEYLGHSDPGFSLRVYTHLMPSSDERTRKAVDGAFACYISATSQPENTGSEREREPFRDI